MCVLLKISSLLLLLLLCLLLHIHTDFALLSPTQKKTLSTHLLLVGGSGVVHRLLTKTFSQKGVDKEKGTLLKAQALFSCRLRVVFDTESRRRSRESPERFLIPKDSILWILIGNTNAAGVVVLVVFPRARPRCSRRRTTTTRLLLLLLPFRRKRRRRKRRR